MEKVNVAIVGGGPGGYVAAIRCRQYEIDVVLFEKEKMGGVCLNWGCIPTKSLVKVADLFHEIKNCNAFGISTSSPELNYEAVWQRKNKIVQQLGMGINHIFQKRKIPVYNETVKKIKKADGHYILFTEQGEYAAEHIILATGSLPKELPDIKIDGKDVLSSSDLLELRELPGHMVVVGGGVIGCEFASIYAQMGVAVEIVEFLPSLVDNEDEEIGKRLAMAMKKAKIKLHLKTAVESYEKQDGKLIVNLSNGKQITTDKILLSVGRIPSCHIETEGFTLQKSNDFIEIDDECRTNEKNIFAIGDVTGKLMLAHVASKQGLIVTEILKKEIKGEKANPIRLHYYNVPRCTFTNPEIGSVGLTTKQAKEQYDEILIGKSSFMANGKALGLGDTYGFVKVIAAKKSGRIVGVHIIGPQATELIAQCSVMIALQATIEEADKIVFAHPTLSEAIMEALEDLENRAIHSV